MLAFFLVFLRFPVAFMVGEVDRLSTFLLMFVWCRCRMRCCSNHCGAQEEKYEDVHVVVRGSSLFAWFWVFKFSLLGAVTVFYTIPPLFSYRSESKRMWLYDLRVWESLFDILIEVLATSDSCSFHTTCVFLGQDFVKW